MITHEQYLEYKRLVEEYEESEERDDHDVNDRDYDDDFDEFDTRLNCKCGAWSYGPKGFIHVADCICGAE